MKFKLAIIVTAFVLRALTSSAQTNLSSYYNAHEFELEGGISQSFANTMSHRNAGANIGVTYWQTLRTGTVIRAGVEDVRAPNPLIFDYTEIGESGRLIWWRFAPAFTIYLGTEYIDGSKYTKPEASLEFRFTKNFGLKLAVNDKLSTSNTGGPGGFLDATYDF